jgi:hypothetical protein
MGRRLYLFTRDSHLYAGLFLSPFLLVFAGSVLFLVHRPRSPAAGPPTTRIASDLPVTTDLERLTGLDQVAALRPALKRMGVEGEVNFIRRIPKEHRLVFPVMLPGHETTVDLNLLGRTATIAERATGVSDALVHLHKMPGPHNAKIRGNSTYIRIWRWLADITTYGSLFLTLSGVYLWAALRAERRVGLALVCAGGVSFFGLAYAVVR